MTEYSGQQAELLEAHKPMDGGRDNYELEYVDNMLNEIDIGWRPFWWIAIAFTTWPLKRTNITGQICSRKNHQVVSTFIGASERCSIEVGV